MPARIVLAHDEIPFLESACAALRGAGHDVAAFCDPIRALEALEAARRVELLITRVNFGEGKLHGLALARMARYKRPGVRVVFMASAECVEHVEHLGECLLMPLSVEDLVAAAERTLAAEV